MGWMIVLGLLAVSGCADSDSSSGEGAPVDPDGVPVGEGLAGNPGDAPVVREPPVAGGECEPSTFASTPVVPNDRPNLWVVFDRSAGMADAWGSAPRWQVVRDALHGAVAPMAGGFEQTGAVFFPASGLSSEGAVADGESGCDVESTAGSGDDLVATLAADDGMSRYRPSQSDTKPMRDALMAVDGVIGDSGTTIVVVVATGGPVCDWDHAEGVRMVASWKLRGAKTHVIELPGVSEADGRRLNSIAIAGGTADPLRVASPEQLEGALVTILASSEAVPDRTCLFELDRKVEDVDAFRVVFPVGGEEEVQAPREWWSLEENNTRVRFFDPACGTILSGVADHLVPRFEETCP